MTGPSTAKEFHRLMKRIGRLTDGQASIDNVDWDNGNLYSFCVTIRPNASYYKGGRFKFTVEMPDDMTGEMPGVWCDTDIYHPNIDRHETKHDRFSTNICLNVFGNAVWDTRFGLEGVVIGILFLMHNPNFSDPLSPEFDGGSIDKETFADNVKDYMAGKTVEDEYDYNIDFRVIDGVFEDLTLIENNVKENKTAAETNCIANNAASNEIKEPADDESVTADQTETAVTKLDASIVSGENDTKTGDVKEEITFQDPEGNVDNVELASTEACNSNTNNSTKDITDYMNELNNCDTDDEDDEEVLPVRFVIDEEHDEYYVIDFGENIGCASEDTGTLIESTDEDKQNDDKINEEIKEPVESIVNNESCDIYDYKRRRSETVSDYSNTQRNELLVRSISVPNDFHPKHYVRLKPVNSVDNDTMNMKQMACLALQCIFTVYRNML